ncbi:ArsR/SmtB family transcription factor [Embleya sp. NPDC020630]|uniref:ArsR/SmtB family transcription factor n=1 Tax=Embleya sp. NPDC020630 TaxID=3363979 RepID=UPI00379EA0A1
MPGELFHPETDDVTLAQVLAALDDPMRLRIVKVLVHDPDATERTCTSFQLPVGKSTLTHHFRILREAGLIRQVDRGNSRKAQLRREDIDRRFPGLLSLILAEGTTPESGPAN